MPHVGVADRLQVIVVEATVDVVWQTHSLSPRAAVPAASFLADASQVIPDASPVGALWIGVVVLLDATRTRTVSGVWPVAHDATDMLVPEVHVPVLSLLAPESSAGTAAWTKLVTTVEVDVVPDVVVSPLQRVPHVPTVVLLVK